MSASASAPDQKHPVHDDLGQFKREFQYACQSNGSNLYNLLSDIRNPQLVDAIFANIMCNKDVKDAVAIIYSSADPSEKESAKKVLKEFEKIALIAYEGLKAAIFYDREIQSFSYRAKYPGHQPDPNRDVHFPIIAQQALNLLKIDKYTPDRIEQLGMLAKNIAGSTNDSILKAGLKDLLDIPEIRIANLKNILHALATGNTKDHPSIGKFKADINNALNADATYESKDDHIRALEHLALRVFDAHHQALQNRFFGKEKRNEGIMKLFKDAFPQVVDEKTLAVQAKEIIKTPGPEPVIEAQTRERSGGPGPGHAS